MADTQSLPALTILQPWAWLIVRPDLTDPEDRRRQCKNIENRSWATKLRGPFLIHAGKSPVNDAMFKSAMEVVEHGIRMGALPQSVADALERKPWNSFEYGGIVGSARLVNCGRYPENPWWMGQQGFELEEIAVLPFRPCRGALGFFRPSF